MAQPDCPSNTGLDTGAMRRPDHTWQRGHPYERYVGRWSRRVAPEFLAWLAAPAGRRWVDVGCGTGALSGAILEHAEPASIVGVEPSAGFLQVAAEHLRERGGERLRWVQAGAAEMPLPDRSADVVVAGLVLNFLPDLPAALAEMQRVAAPGATVAGYVWDYAGRMDLMRHFWDAAAALDPAAAALDEGRRFPLCQPEALRAAFNAAGLQEVEVRAIDIPTVFSSFGDYWTPFLGGQGPAPAYAMSLDEAARERLRQRLRERVPQQPDGTMKLMARAHAVRGVVP